MYKTPLTTISTILALCGACDLHNAPDDELDVVISARRGDGGGGLGGPIGFNNDHHAVLHLLVDALGAEEMSVVLRVGGVEHELDAVWADAGRLYGTSEGVEYSGVDFLDSIWQVPLYYPQGYGEHVGPIEITAVVEGDIDSYEFQDVELQYALCSGHLAGGVMAVVVSDVQIGASGNVSERAGALMIACETGGVAKAIQWGYGPEGPAGVGGFQTAVRMVIADYCGDGSSYTEEGTPIWMKDGWSLHATDGSGAIEAGWSDDGATCLSLPRDSTLSPEDVACGPLPECSADPLADGADLVTWNT